MLQYRSFFAFLDAVFLQSRHQSIVVVEFGACTRGASCLHCRLAVIAVGSHGLREPTFDQSASLTGDWKWNWCMLLAWLSILTTSVQAQGDDLLVFGGASRALVIVTHCEEQMMSRGEADCSF